MTLSGPLSAQRKLNVRAVQEACCELESALATEAMAVRRAAETEREISREVERATCLTATDALVEALGSWLPQARNRAFRARAAAESARAKADHCRAVLAAARRVAGGANRPAAAAR